MGLTCRIAFLTVLLALVPAAPAVGSPDTTPPPPPIPEAPPQSAEDLAVHAANIATSEAMQRPPGPAPEAINPPTPASPCGRQCLDALLAPWIPIYTGPTPPPTGPPPPPPYDPTPIPGLEPDLPGPPSAGHPSASLPSASLPSVSAGDPRPDAGWMPGSLNVPAAGVPIAVEETLAEPAISDQLGVPPSTGGGLPRYEQSQPTQLVVPPAASGVPKETSTEVRLELPTHGPRCEWPPELRRSSS
jgi:hypothetical protein